MTLGILLRFAAPAPGEELLVSAAASLTNAFKAIGTEFDRVHPRDKLIFNFAASDVLMRQIVEGAPVDVFASADEDAMDKAVKAKVMAAASRFNFAANRLVLAVPRDSPLRLAALDDLHGKTVKRIALGQPATVPAGRYARAALEKARLWSLLQDRFIYTQNVRQCLDYLARAEVDAGFVYATDVEIAKNQVRSVLTVATQQPVWYPIAVTARGENSKLAREFIDLVRSPHGQSILRQFGFLKP